MLCHYLVLIILFVCLFVLKLRDCILLRYIFLHLLTLLKIFQLFYPSQAVWVVNFFSPSSNAFCLAMNASLL